MELEYFLRGLPYSVFEPFSLCDCDSPEKCNTRVAEQITKFYAVNKSMIGDPKMFASFSNFAQSELTNRFTVFESGVRFDCSLDIKANEYLFILFKGAIGDRKIANVPIFLRYSWASLFPGSVLCIEDPMYHTFSDLRLGWYYGTPKKNYINMICTLIFLIAQKIDAKKIVTYGSSGGGYAAIQVATSIPDSIAVAINPQIEIRNYGYAKIFTELTRNNLYNTYELRNDTGNAMLASSKAKFFIIQNSFDSSMLQHHIIPLCKQYGLDMIKYGLTLKNNMLLWLYHAQSGHQAMDRKNILPFIINLAMHYLETKDFQVTKQLDSLYIAVSEIWSDIDTLTNISGKKSNNAVLP